MQTQLYERLVDKRREEILAADHAARKAVRAHIQ